MELPAAHLEGRVAIEVKNPKVAVIACQRPCQHCDGQPHPLIFLHVGVSRHWGLQRMVAKGHYDLQAE